MPAYSSLEAAIDPNNRLTFLLDWELTMKCNLDCSYCGTPATAPIDELGHDPDADHPPLSQCLDTIDFMYAYVDLYMQYKPKWSRAAVLNIYGGESLIHPDIVEIAKQTKIKYQPYKDRWALKVSCTTNAVIGRRRMQEILPFVDEFTVSYHVESLAKQKQQVKDNLLLLKNAKKDVKCVVLMHGDSQYWPELIELMDFCNANEIRYLARALDGPVKSNYNTKQIQWFKKQWLDRSPKKSAETQMSAVAHHDQLYSDSVALTEIGRACCGGRLVCQDGDMKHPIHFAPDNNFTDWHCSVNWFFLYVKQHTGEIFVNKDCRMSFDETVGPIGHMTDTDKLLETTKAYLNTGNMPVIRCKKSICRCGICAPKAKNRQVFGSIMQKYINNIDLLC